MATIKKIYKNGVEYEMPQGPVGPQGATGVYDSTTQDFLTTLETTTGQSQTKTMTQKAVTDELEKGKVYKETEISISAMTTNAWYINDSDKWKKADSTTYGSHAEMKINGGETFKIVGNTLMNVEFADNWTEVVVDANALNNISGGVRLGWHAAGTFYVTAPASARYLYIRRKVNENDDRTPQHVYLCHEIDAVVDVLDAEKKVSDRMINGISYTSGIKLKTSGAEVTDSQWGVTDYIPCKKGDKFGLAYYKAESGTSALCLYDEAKNLLNYYSTYSTSTSQHRVVTPQNDGIAYCRFCFYTDNTYYASLAINDEVVWTSGTLGRKMKAEAEKVFLSTAKVREFSVLGQGSTFASMNFGHLQPGRTYRLQIDDTEPFDSYLSSLTGNSTRFSLQPFNAQSTAISTTYTAMSSMPIPQVFEFVAEDNVTYNLAVRVASGTRVYCKLIGYFDEEIQDNRAERSLIKQAKYVGIDSGVLPAIGLLHYSDLHGDQYAADEILAAVDKYGAYIDDVLSTGDMVRENADGSSTYPQGTAWWQASGLPEKSLFVLGNHDNATASATQYDQKENSNAWDGKGIDYAVAQYFSPYDSEFGANYHRPSGKCYWYKDYTSQKVRMIGLDCMHRFDGIVDPTTGQQDGDNAGLKHLTTEQEEWLVARLNETITSGNAANGFSVIVACHYPLDDFNYTVDGENMEWDDTTHKWVCNQKSTGGRVINQKTGEVTNWHYLYGDLNLEAKFSLRNRVSDGYPEGAWPNYTKGVYNNFGEIIKTWMSAGGKFVAWLCGHVHGDLMYYPKPFPNILTIAINQAGSLGWNNIAAERDTTFARCVANYIAVDTTHSLLKIVRIGMKDSRLLVPTTYLCYDYANHKVIQEG